MCIGKRVSPMEDKGIYNPAVKKQVRKDKFEKDSLSFMILGSQDRKKQVFCCCCLNMVLWLFSLKIHG